jgi:4-amino-4-deoxy-L-arabinose transferase-like glycosyltransferase
MKFNDNDSPLKVYIIAGHLAWLFITPLLVFIGGGSWLTDQMGWDNRIKIVFVLIGLFVMIGSVANYLRNLIKMYEAPPDNPVTKLEKDDYDY